LASSPGENLPRSKLRSWVKSLPPTASSSMSVRTHPSRSSPLLHLLPSCPSTRPRRPTRHRPRLHLRRPRVRLSAGETNRTLLIPCPCPCPSRLRYRRQHPATSSPSVPIRRRSVPFSDARIADKNPPELTGAPPRITRLPNDVLQQRGFTMAPTLLSRQNALRIPPSTGIVILDFPT